MKRLIAVSLLLTGSLWLPPVAGQDETEAEYQPLHPSQLAAESDAVVLAQVDRVNYETRRGFPVSGAAWIRVLVRYKVPSPIDFVKGDRRRIRTRPLLFRRWTDVGRNFRATWSFSIAPTRMSFKDTVADASSKVLGHRRQSLRGSLAPSKAWCSIPKTSLLIQELTFQGPGA